MAELENVAVDPLVLAKAIETLAHVRQELRQWCNTLFGAFIDPPANSNLYRLMVEVSTAETNLSAELYRFPRKGA